VHIYAFGSVCRGDTSFGSDVDLLALVDSRNPALSPELYSIYSYKRMQELWNEGNPFAWHLYLESRLIFSSTRGDAIQSFGTPAKYAKGRDDCEKFRSLFLESSHSILCGSKCAVFDLSTIFLSVRNFATCFSLGVLKKPDFSRNAALRLDGDSIKISEDSYRIFERARILCTRGEGIGLSQDEISRATSELAEIRAWMDKLLVEVNKNG
jgi:hypothetical protein